MKEHNTNNTFFSAEREIYILESFSAYLHSKNNGVKFFKMTMYLYTIASLGVLFERQIQLKKKKIQLLFILRVAVCLKLIVFIHL